MFKDINVMRITILRNYVNKECIQQFANILYGLHNSNGTPYNFCHLQITHHHKSFHSHRFKLFSKYRKVTFKFVFLVTFFYIEHILAIPLKTFGR